MGWGCLQNLTSANAPPRPKEEPLPPQPANSLLVESCIVYYPYLQTPCTSSAITSLCWKVQCYGPSRSSDVFEIHNGVIIDFGMYKKLPQILCVGS